MVCERSGLSKRDRRGPAREIGHRGWKTGFRLIKWLLGATRWRPIPRSVGCGARSGPCAESAAVLGGAGQRRQRLACRSQKLIRAGAEETRGTRLSGTARRRWSAKVKDGTQNRRMRFTARKTKKQRSKKSPSHLTHYLEGDSSWEKCGIKNTQIYEEER